MKGSDAKHFSLAEDKWILLCQRLSPCVTRITLLKKPERPCSSQWMNGVFFIKQNPCMRIRSKQPTAISTHILRPCFCRIPRLLSGKGGKGCGCLPAEAVPFSFSFSINITHYPLTFPLPLTLTFTFTLSLGFASENLWFLYSKPLVFIPETIGFPFG